MTFTIDATTGATFFRRFALESVSDMLPGRPYWGGSHMTMLVLCRSSTGNFAVSTSQPASHDSPSIVARVAPPSLCTPTSRCLCCSFLSPLGIRPYIPSVFSCSGSHRVAHVCPCGPAGGGDAASSFPHTVPIRGISVCIPILLREDLPLTCSYRSRTGRDQNPP